MSDNSKVLFKSFILDIVKLKCHLQNPNCTTTKLKVGCCSTRLRLHSGGLKQIRGSWLCLDLGPLTWRPPVNTGPRE